MTYEYVTYIAAPANVVWQHLTVKSKVDKYFLAPLKRLDLEVGTKISYGTPQHNFIEGVIHSVKQNEILSHSFSFPHLEEDGVSHVTYVLKNLGPMTALVLLHRDLKEDSQTYADVSNGWPGMLSNLKTLLETGRTLPWPQS